MRTFIATALSLAVLVSLVVLATARQSSLADWHQYKSKHGKWYANKTEDAQRFTLFLAAKDKISRHNLKPVSTGHKLGLNYMADWTPAEFAKLNGLRYNREEHKLRLEASKDDALLRSILEDDSRVPDEVDWRKVRGRVTPVKNQGHCGSCWAFATTGLLEGQEYKFRNRREVPLSEQELVECSHGNAACDGGIMSAALADINKMGGIQWERDYPYVAPEVDACHFSRSEVVFTDKGSLDLPANNEVTLKAAVARYGPVAVAVAANDNLRLYEKGVFSDPHCSDQLNHGVLIVGYGTDKKEGDYWLVKNSWGAEWGEEGYFRMKRGVGMCGIGSLATIATF